MIQGEEYVDFVYFLEAGDVDYKDSFLLHNDNTDYDGNENGNYIVWMLP